MATPQKFRSIKAFRDLEERPAPSERTLSTVSSAAEPEPLSPFRLLALLKERPGGATRGELAQDLHVAAPALDGALLKLYKEGLVEVEAGSRADDDRVKAL